MTRDVKPIAAMETTFLFDLIYSTVDFIEKRRDVMRLFCMPSLKGILNIGSSGAYSEARLINLKICTGVLQPRMLPR